MINQQAKLSEKIFTKDIDLVAIRQGYGEGLLLAGEKDERVVVLSADLSDSTKADLFKAKFPERYIEVGVAEQAMATIASGMANYGKIPFINSFAVFSPGRNWEQIRTTIALNDVPVKIAGHHTGISVGEDGATHQALEDIALMRVMPNMQVVVPGDAIEAKKAVVAAVDNGKPTYIKITRHASAVFTTDQSPFEIGKANVLLDDPNSEVVVFACGYLVHETLLAAKQLEEGGIKISVLNLNSIKPLGEDTIISFVRKTHAAVSVEDHQVAGGMGSAVAEVLAKHYPVPMEFVGMQDAFGESGRAGELLAKYKMTKQDIVEAVKKVVARKNY